MLKIERSAKGDLVVFALSGRIDVEHAVDLQATFDEQKGRIVLDLAEVKRVDRAAVPFLARWHAAGITLENCPIYVREWIAKTRAPKDRP